MQNLKTIVITGSNKGVGFGILENLVQKPYRVIMACRNLELATKTRQQVIDTHKIDGNKLEVIELDISKSASIDKFLVEFAQRFQTADILINNAGVATKGDDFNIDVVNFTFKTNLYGTVELSEKFLPYLNENGKIITIGSSTGKLKILTNDDLKHRFTKENISKEEVFKLANEFEQHVQKGDFKEHGWPEWGYGVSKLLINTFARTLAQYPTVLQKHIQVYVCCPGWVKTDMAGQEAHLTIDQGALTPVYLVELPHVVDPAKQGKFFYLNQVNEL